MVILEVTIGREFWEETVSDGSMPWFMNKISKLTLIDWSSVATSGIAIAIGVLLDNNWRSRP